MTRTVASISQSVELEVPRFQIEVFLRLVDTSNIAGTIAEQRLTRKLHKALAAQFIDDGLTAKSHKGEDQLCTDWDEFAATRGLETNDPTSKQAVQLSVHKLVAEHGRKLISKLLEATNVGPDGRPVSYVSGVGARWLLDLDDCLADALGEEV